MERLGRIVEEKSLPALSAAIAEDSEVAELLQNRDRITNGMSLNEIELARQRFGVNELPKARERSFLAFVWSAAQDNILILLMVSASISILINWREGAGGFVEGIAILVAVVVVVSVNAGSDYHKSRLFSRLNAQNQAGMLAKVRRNGQDEQRSVEELTCGDVLLLEPGIMIPADAIVVAMNTAELQVDESSATGESRTVSKNAISDPFLLSGTKLMDGSGRAVIVAVGVKSFHGRMMMAMRGDVEQTPLQIQLNRLANQIAKLGVTIATGLLLALCAKTWWLTGSLGAVLQALPEFLIETITIVVVAVPEGLPMAVTLALAFATNRMLLDGNLVRVLASCETMGRVTTVCSDKTGTLTQNRMTVVREYIDEDALFVEGAAVNSTAFESVNGQTGIVEFVGSGTETALLKFIQAKHPRISYQMLRKECKIEQVVPFSSARKLMATLIRAAGGGWRLHVKGAAELILEMCTMSPDKRRECKRLLAAMNRDALRSIALAYLPLTSPPASVADVLHGKPAFQWIGMVGIEDPLREGVDVAVKTCQEAGIFVRMVTGDCRETAESIARRCGILMRGGLVMEGKDFRSRSDEELIALLPKLQVLARSSPLDKKRLVNLLRGSIGEIVAVTGDGSNDGPALRAAHVGFAMGRTGTQLAKEAASIVLLNDDFQSIVKAASWGRAITRSLRRFLLFQLTVNVAAVITSSVTALTTSHSVLTAVQMLWVNLLMDSLGALALATDPPTPDLLQHPPEKPSGPLITASMRWHIVSQASLQVMLCMAVFYGGAQIVVEVPDRIRTFVFNLFVALQLVNELNCRAFRDASASSAAHSLSLKAVVSSYWSSGRNDLFWLIWVCSLTGQFVIVQWGGSIFDTTALTSFEWFLSWALAASASVFLFVLVNVARPWRFNWISPRLAVGERPLHATREQLAWTSAMHGIRARTQFYSAIRGRLLAEGLDDGEGKFYGRAGEPGELIPPSSSPCSDDELLLKQ